MPSLKTNFIYNFILIGGNQLFALLVFPYISRVLGPENVGIVNFVDSAVDYFVAISMMGIMSIGVREIAASRSDPARLDAAFSGLFIVNLLFTALALLGLLAAYLLIPALASYPRMAALGAVKLICKFLMIEWLFCGLEDFKFISVRSLIIKFLYMVGVFVFVREASDYEVYYVLLVAIWVASAVVNLRYGRLRVRLVSRSVEWRRFVKPFLFLGLYKLIIGMYATFNSVYLGVAADEREVGYYTTAVRLFAVIIGFYYAFTGVALPRMSSLLSEQRMEEFDSLVRRTTNVLIAVAVPAICFGVGFSRQIVFLIAGPEFEASVVPMAIIFPLLFVNGYNMVLIEQILMPFKKDKLLMRNAGFYAAVAVVLNVLLVKPLGAIGSALVWASAEVVLLLLSARAAGAIMPLRFPWRDLARQVALYLPLGIGAWALGRIDCSLYVQIIAGVLFASLYFVAAQTAIVKTPEILTLLAKALPRAARR